MKLKKIISGAQSGADLAGLDVAKEFSLETGGIMPFGYKTLDGCKPEYKDLYGVSCHCSSSYAPRTRENVKNSDGTLRLAFNFSSRGEICTLKAIKDCKKPYFDVNLSDPSSIEDVIMWMKDHNIETLNIAGNSEKTHPGTYQAARSFLTRIMERICDKDVEEKIGDYEGTSI